jgi:hypothetical protein
MNRFYLVSAVALLGFFFFAEASGWELATPARQVVPADVRQSPGGYRSFHFWHSGWHGGK